MQMSFRFSLQRKSQLNADRRLPWRCAKHYPKIKGKHWCERIQIDRVQKRISTLLLCGWISS